MDRPDRYFIPDNLNDGRAVLHIPNRNLIDTVAMEIILFAIMRALPLPAVPKVVAGAIVMIGAGIFGIAGIKNESVSEFLSAYLRHRGGKKKLHYRRPDQNNEFIEKTVGEN